MTKGVRRVTFTNADVMQEFHISPESIYELDYSHRGSAGNDGEKFLGLAFVILWPNTCNSRFICNSLRDHLQFDFNMIPYTLSCKDLYYTLFSCQIYTLRRPVMGEVLSTRIW